MTNLYRTLILAALMLLTACGTTDSQLVQQGHNQAYLDGFHDGRHSGIKEAGNNFEHFIRDEVRFTESGEYRTGWLAGEAEGKRLQAQADSIGTAMGNAYTAGQISKEVDKQSDADRAAGEVLKNTDTSVLKNLED